MPVFLVSYAKIWFQKQYLAIKLDLMILNRYLTLNKKEVLKSDFEGIAL